MGFIIAALVLVAGIGAVALAGATRARGVFKQIYGDKSLKQVVQEGEWEESNVPKSISNATSLYLPRIQKDFPEFMWNEMQLKAKNVLKSMLMAINAHDMSLLSKDANDELKTQVELIINDDNNGGVRTYYDDITVHQVEIWRYIKRDGLCTVEMQASAGYRMWKVTNGELFYGSKDKLRQAKYKMELIYVQDINKIKNMKLVTQGINCKNCGAPITTLGAKHCTYCGAAVYDVNIKIWKFGSITAIKG